MRTAFAGIDIQRDFAEGGNLAVEGGHAVAHDTHHYLQQASGIYVPGCVLATKDWHNREGDNGGHFSDDPDFKDTWVHHCVASSLGAEFCPPLSGLDFDEVFLKGWNEPAYSGFQGHGERHHVCLDDYLKGYQIERIDVAGLASTHCVKATVFDALDLGYEVRVLSVLTAGVGGTEPHVAALKEMHERGAVIL